MSHCAGVCYAEDRQNVIKASPHKMGMEGGRFCVSLMLLFKKERLKVIKKFIIISVHYNVKMCMNLFHYLFFCPEIFVNI